MDIETVARAFIALFVALAPIFLVTRAKSKRKKKEENSNA
jgi:hypothetical protein